MKEEMFTTRTLYFQNTIYLTVNKIFFFLSIIKSLDIFFAKINKLYLLTTQFHKQVIFRRQVNNVIEL